ncbi:DUF6520 family protein [Hufsiella ginkgonis]|uniref:DUF4377 domain-containing protein n=1 Tax=Hufsiella ginkgonis TaxID=2695274 RepID=A0A7K1XZB5_9SPHI|nr:DUF6520 family protein [Hufsiella ginkgonis]MXV16079.1 hypothetical protein [Hufsiella ginkgonis]
MKTLKFPSGIMALALGLGLALTTQSFKAEKTGELYGYNQSAEQWEQVSEIEEGYTYRCDLNPAKECTAEFTTDPNQDPSSQANTEHGVYTIVEIQ